MVNFQKSPLAAIDMLFKIWT